MRPDLVASCDLQDHVVAGVLLSKRDTFLTRSDFMQLLYAACCASVPGADAAGFRLDVPPPAVVAPRVLYTGKQASRCPLRAAPAPLSTLQLHRLHGLMVQTRWRAFLQHPPAGVSQR